MVFVPGSGPGAWLVVGGLAIVLATAASRLLTDGFTTDSYRGLLYAGAVACFGATAAFLGTGGPVSSLAIAAGWLCLVGALSRQYRETLREMWNGPTA